MHFHLVKPGLLLGPEGQADKRGDEDGEGKKEGGGAGERGEERL